MSEKGAALQTYNQELVKGIEALKRKRADLMQSIREDEHRKALLEKELSTVQGKLSVVSNNLNETLKKKKYYDEAIENSEAAYMKILESSQALLNSVRHEASALDQYTDSSRDATTCIEQL